MARLSLPLTTTKFYDTFRCAILVGLVFQNGYDSREIFDRTLSNSKAAEPPLHLLLG